MTFVKNWVFHDFFLSIKTFYVSEKAVQWKEEKKGAEQKYQEKKFAGVIFLGIFVVLEI